MLYFEIFRVVVQWIDNGWKLIARGPLKHQFQDKLNYWEINKKKIVATISLIVMNVKFVTQNTQKFLKVMRARKKRYYDYIDQADRQRSPWKINTANNKRNAGRR